VSWGGKSKKFWAGILKNIMPALVDITAFRKAQCLLCYVRLPTKWEKFAQVFMFKKNIFMFFFCIDKKGGHFYLFSY
jgi:hypothetical protein